MPLEVPDIEEIGEKCSNVKLIEVVQSLPELWDKDHERFKSSIKASYWRIMAGTKTGGPLLKKRWERLAKAYSSERKKYTPSGSGGGSHVPMFAEYSLLGFLDKVLDDSVKRVDSGAIGASLSSKSDEDLSLTEDVENLEAKADGASRTLLLDRNPLKRRKQMNDESTDLDALITKIESMVDKESTKKEQDAYPEKDKDVHDILQECLASLNPIRASMFKVDLYLSLKELTLKHKGTLPELLHNID